jgi:tRNA(Ile2) C34 agmatinyltransferase TiaS
MIGKDEFEEKVLKLAEKYTLRQCIYCDPGTLVSVEGMLDFKCIKCGRTMKPELYLEEFVKLVSKYREQMGINNDI